jgi:hypothetical protein
MGKPANKIDVLEKLYAERRRLELLIGTLNDEQLTVPGVMGHWSIKDIMAHISFWEDRGCQILDAALHNRKPTIFDEPFDLDALNAAAYKQYKDRPLTEIRTRFFESFRQYATLVESLSEDQLSDPKRYDWAEDTPMWQYVESDGTHHYSEHADHIEAWLNRPEE